MQCFLALSYSLPPPDQLAFVATALALRAIVPSILEYSATTRNCGYFGPFCCVGIAHWHRIDGIERAAVVNMKLSIFRVSDQKITFRDQISVNFDFFLPFPQFCPQGREPSGVRSAGRPRS